MQNTTPDDPSQNHDNSPSIKTAALRLIAMGFRVVPLWGVRAGEPGPDGTLPCCCPQGLACDRNSGKHPFTPIAPRGVVDATADPEAVERWPDAGLNLGIATGQMTDGRYLIGFDVDGPAQLEAFKTLGATHGPWPVTTVVESGRDGHRHVYLTADRELHGFTIDKASEFQVRGQRQLLVVPPSLHFTGRRYRFARSREGLCSFDRLAPAPAWFVELAEQHGQGGDALLGDVVACPLPARFDGNTLLHVLIGDLPTAKQRHVALFQLACELRRAAGADGEDLNPLTVAGVLKWLDIEQLSRHPNGSKFWGRDDADVRYREIAQRSQVAVVQGGVLTIETNPVTGRKQEGKMDEFEGPSIISARDLQKLDLPPLRMVTPLLQEGVVLTAGPPKIGKSWFVLGEAIEVSKLGRVLVIFLEDGQRRVKDRLQKLLGDEPWPEQLEIATSWPRFDEGGLDDMRSWLAAHADGVLIVVDVFARARGKAKRGDDRYEADYAALAAVQDVAMAHPGVCISVVHHTRKAEASDPLDLVSGTQGIAGAVDAVRVLQRERGAADAVLHVMGRDTEEQEIGLSFDAGVWTVLGDAAELRRSQARRELLFVLEEVHEPLSPKEITGRLPGRKNEGTVRSLLRKMLEDGEVKSPERGKYVPAVYLMEQFLP